MGNISGISEHYVRELEEKIALLEAENKVLRQQQLKANGHTVKVPNQFRPIFDKAQQTVGEYFKDLRFNPEHASITIDDQRYVLVRASALSYDFLNTISMLYADRGVKKAFNIGKSFLFDISRVIGVNDAHNFHKKMHLNDPVEKLSAGPVHFAYSGWAFVDILPESKPSPDENYFLTYHHPYSFEADSWIKAGKKAESPVCIMNAGYSSGWCEASFGLELTAVEISCRACGDENCTFIMAPPHKINYHLERILAQKDHLFKKHMDYDIPTFFERKKVEEEMEKSRRKAEESDQSKSDFLANMSHEIRTPLNAILGYVELMMQDDMREEHKEYLHSVKESGQLLQRVINDILDLSKIEAGQLLIEKINYSTRNIFDYTEDIGRSLMMQKTKKVKLIKAIDPNLAEEIFTDPVRLQQLMYNLISNAIKFTEEGSIEFGGHLEKKGWLTLFVKDSGIGIPEDKQHLIFDKFLQADASTTRKYGGSGLGLTICKKLVHLLGGEIWVESDGKTGSTFYVSIPYHPVQEEKKITIVADRVEEPSSSQTVLLVEDNLVNLKLTQKVLEKNGYKVLCARNGEEALDKFRRYSEIEVVIMDLQMPVMDGLTAVAEMRKTEKLMHRTETPMVALTAHAMKGDMEKCLEAGFNAYVSKPFSIDTLLRTILQVTETKD